MERKWKWFVGLLATLFAFNLMIGVTYAAKAPEPRLAVFNADGTRTGQVKVLKGDTLWGITEKCDRPGTDFGSLLRVNPQLPKSQDRGHYIYARIHEGQVLNLPPGWRVNPRWHQDIAPLSPANAQIRSGAPDNGVKSKPATEQLWSWPAGWLWILAILVMAALLCMFVIARRGTRQRKEEATRDRFDPDNYPPVIPEGLNRNGHVAARQIEQAYPSREGQIRRVERGVVRQNARPPFVANMLFGDDEMRRVLIQNGDQAHRVTLLDGTVEFYRSHCGNLYGPEMRSGRFELPAGWEFVPDHDLQAVAEVRPHAPRPPVPPAPPAQAEPVSGAATEVPATEEPAPAPAAPEPAPPTASAPATGKSIKVTVTVGDAPPRSVEVSGSEPAKVFVSASGNVDVIFNKQ